MRLRLGPAVRAAAWLAAAMLAAGCLSIPDYKPTPLVTYTEDNTGATVAASGFALHFAGGNEFHFPDALMIDGSDVMGHDPSALCSDQNESGIQITPTSRISPTGGAKINKNELLPVLRGPAVAQMTLAWSTEFTCDSVTRTPGGTSTFTVFPDGRIVRYDVLDDPNTMHTFPAGCRCTDDNFVNFSIATFWTFARRTPDFTLYAPDTATQIGLPIAGSEATNQDTTCLDGGAYQMAFAWPNNKPFSPDKGSVIRGGKMLIGAGFYAQIQAPAIDRLSFDISSAMFIGRDQMNPCKAPIALAKEYITPPTLTINDSFTTMPALSNGIYGGDVGNDGQPGLELMTDHAELKGLMNERFAVWLRFPHAVGTIRATHPGSTGAWYVPQRVDDRSWIVWFQDPPKDTEPIKIEPN